VPAYFVAHLVSHEKEIRKKTTEVRIQKGQIEAKTHREDSDVIAEEN
jgi:hypothetical protein